MYINTGDVLKEYLTDIDAIIALETEEAFKTTSISNPNIYSFIAGKRSGLVLAKERLLSLIEEEKDKQRMPN